MAIRRPSIYSPDWVFQDFLYQAATDLGGTELRYLQIKWDGEIYTSQSQTYDYSNPPWPDNEQRGGSIVGQVDYAINVSARVITIYSWAVNWRDEWPLRLAVNYLIECLYPASGGYNVLVAGDQVYNQAGDAIEDPSNFPYAFWVSEKFNPLSNEPNNYLVRSGTTPSPTPPTPIVYGFESAVQVTYSSTYILVSISTEGVSLQTPLYWRITGGITPTILVDGFTEGVKVLNGPEEFVKIPLEVPYPSGVTGTVEFYTDSQYTTPVGTTLITL